jgi:hypothetical protein
MKKKFQFLQKEKKSLNPITGMKLKKKSQSNFGFQMSFNFGHLQCHNQGGSNLIHSSFIHFWKWNSILIQILELQPGLDT